MKGSKPKSLKMKKEPKTKAQLKISFYEFKCKRGALCEVKQLKALTVTLMVPQHSHDCHIKLAVHS